MRNLKRSALALSILIALLCAITRCDSEYPLMTDDEIVRAKKHNLREWREAKEGVIYFTTCAEGLLLIATPSTHGATQMAGPIGDCT